MADIFSSLPEHCAHVLCSCRDAASRSLTVTMLPTTAKTKPRKYLVITSDANITKWTRECGNGDGSGRVTEHSCPKCFGCSWLKCRASYRIASPEEKRDDDPPLLPVFLPARSQRCLRGVPPPRPARSAPTARQGVLRLQQLGAQMPRHTC